MKAFVYSIIDYENDGLQEMSSVSSPEREAFREMP